MENEKESLGMCPHCGGNDIYGVTRVVGYFAKIENMLPTKISEIKDRQRGNYDLTAGEALPLNFNFGEDGIYLIGKEACSYCVSEEDIVNQAVKDAGLEGKVNVFVKKIAKANGDISPENLAIAAKMEVPLSRIPAIVFVRDGKLAYKQATDYDSEAGVPTMEQLTDAIRRVYQNAA
jgi:hypothetical protein